MFKKISSVLVFASLLAAITVATSAVASAHGNSDALRVSEPLNIAILIQDDLTSRVGNELGVTRQFIRSLPAGFPGMGGYITAGGLQGRAAFANDFYSAARLLCV